MTTPTTKLPQSTPDPDPNADRPARPRIWARLAAAGSSAWFAYATILALQVRVVWEFWEGRDLAAGDTSGYFTVARAWAESFQDVFFWSPLYTAYYGTVLELSGGDPVTATLAHRILLVFGTTVLLLALARRLMPAPAAWAVAAWWALLPVNFDTLYEVHLFGAIPAFAAALVATRWPGHGGRAAVLAILGGAALLVRNEYAFAALLFGLLCLWSLVKELRRTPDRSRRLALLKPYLAGALAAFAVIGFFYARSTVKLPILADIFNQRRTLNFCQAYAYNYSQRDPDWQGNPFTECAALMEQEFELPAGTNGDSVGFVDAFRRDPDAVREYLTWNLRLVPSGIQLALFNGTSGPVTPDYVEVAVNRTLPWVLTIVVLVVLLGGAWALQQEGDLWRDWRQRNRWPLAVLACCSAGVALVMVQQRPRPSYMFPLTATLMGAIVFCGWVLARRAGVSAGLPAALPLVLLVLVAIAPTPYINADTPLEDAYRRLAPHTSELGGGVTAVPAYNEDLCRYLRFRNCRMTGYWATLRPAAEAAGSLERTLSIAGVRAFYADEAILADPLAAGLFGGTAEGWTRVAGDEGRWALVVRADPAGDAG